MAHEALAKRNDLWRSLKKDTKLANDHLALVTPRATALRKDAAKLEQALKVISEANLDYIIIVADPEREEGFHDECDAACLPAEKALEDVEVRLKLI